VSSRRDFVAGTGHLRGGRAFFTGCMQEDASCLTASSTASNMVHPRPLPTPTICWRCQWHLTNQRRAFAHRTLRSAAAARAVARPPRRAFHASPSVMPPFPGRNAC
jgi:hypothetical protein